MSKVVILGGAGEMGSMAVRDLVLNKKISSLVIADKNIDRANELLMEMDDESLSIVELDVTNPGVIAPELLNPKEFFAQMEDRKHVERNVSESGLIVDIIHTDGTIQSLKKGKPLL